MAAPRARSRAATYTMMLGLATGVLVTGLALPFAVGERTSESSVRSEAPLEAAPLPDGTLDGAVGDGIGTDAGGPAADVGDGGAATTSGSAGAAAAPGAGGGTTAGAGGAGGSTVGGAGGSGSGSGGTGATGGAATRGATDVGVTATTIRIGFLLLDVGGIGRVGIGVPGVDPEQQRQTFEAQMAEVNDRGGIHGRKLEGVYEKFDVLSQDDMRRACLALRDRKAFAVVSAGGYYGPAVLCLTEEGRTPLVTQGGQGTPSEYVRRSRGRLFAMYPISDRMMPNWVAELDRMGVLKGKRIGILSSEATNPGDSVVGGELVPALKRFGHEVAHITRFAADPNTAAGQVPVEVQQMRTKDVEVVMILAGTLVATQFVQSADSQGYRPQYTITDWASLNTDASNQNMPASYDGTIGITTYRTGEEKLGVRENAAERDCRTTYERRTKRKLGPKGSNEHGLTVSNCTTLLALLLGLDKAGPTLTRDSLSRGMQAVGPFPMTLWGGGGFAPGKFGAADLVRPMRWFADCRCLKPTGEFRRARF